MANIIYKLKACKKINNNHIVWYDRKLNMNIYIWIHRFDFQRECDFVIIDTA
jgi:hypothetical protein